MSFKKIPPKIQEYRRRKEDGWQMGNLNTVRLKEYNSLHDPNMRHFFENRKVQAHLYRTGQIDRNGRVIDLDRNKNKLRILEKEFDRAERIEEMRQKDELEMRYRVQKKRFAELERVRKEEVMEKLKHDRLLSKEIIETMKGSTSGGGSLVSKGPSITRNNDSLLDFHGSVEEANTPYGQQDFYEGSVEGL